MPISSVVLLCSPVQQKPMNLSHCVSRNGNFLSGNNVCVSETAVRTGARDFFVLPWKGFRSTPSWAQPTWRGLPWCFTLLGPPVPNQWDWASCHLLAIQIALPSLHCLPGFWKMYSWSFLRHKGLVTLPFSVFSWRYSSAPSIWLPTYLCSFWNCFPSLLAFPVWQGFLIFSFFFFLFSKGHLPWLLQCSCSFALWGGTVYTVFLFTVGLSAIV